MRENTDIAKHISSLCSGRWDRSYTRSKILSDPLYAGVYHELKSRSTPLLDIGCGLGLFALYLREKGWSAPVIGFDYDHRKIEEGKQLIASGGYQGITLTQGDVRKNIPHHSGDVTMLDMFQFFETHEQENLLVSAAQRVCIDGKLIIRSGLKANNIRYFLTWFGDQLAKALFWMKAAPTHYPTADFFHNILEKEGFSVDIKPFWGKTPFNNFLIVATRKKD